MVRRSGTGNGMAWLQAYPDAPLTKLARRCSVSEPTLSAQRTALHGPRPKARAPAEAGALRLAAARACRNATEEAEAGLHLCESCPLRKPSLSWALTIPSLLDTAGIWAATTPHQRKKLRRSLRAA